jgi:hypothetical protein
MQLQITIPRSTYPFDDRSCNFKKFRIMKGKQLFFVITCVFVTQALLAQRVKRKGTTPIELIH